MVARKESHRLFFRFQRRLFHYHKKRERAWQDDDYHLMLMHVADSS